jgi:hypothetical protein
VVRASNHFEGVHHGTLQPRCGHLRYSAQIWVAEAPCSGPMIMTARSRAMTMVVPTARPTALSRGAVSLSRPTEGLREPPIRPGPRRRGRKAPDDPGRRHIHSHRSRPRR